MSELLTYKTDLKSLKYSKDRPQSGYSGQPFIQKDIDKEPTNNSTEDFLLRGGLKAVPDALEDVGRLTKYFVNLKSPNGFLFIAKQNILSRSAVRTQTTGDAPTSLGSINLSDNVQNLIPTLNEGAYTPLSTLAQAGTGFLGYHVNKQGLNPFGDTGPYSDNNKLYGVRVKSSQPTDQNRLVNIARSLSSASPVSFSGFTLNPQGGRNKDLLSYVGGPGSDLGIGQTTIRMSSNSITTPGEGKNLANISGLTPLTSEFRAKIGQTFPGLTKAWTYPQLSSLGTVDAINLGEGYDKWKKSNSVEKSPSYITDFRIPTLENTTTSTVTGIAPSYSGNNSKAIEGISDSRIKQISPGQKGNRINYQVGKINEDGNISVVDQINFQPIYKSTSVRASKNGVAKNDFVKFRIGAIMRDGQKIFSHFRAFINSFSDSYNGNWSSIKYMGRGEDFYKYGGFGRSISLSFTVAAQSKPELMAQYKKLNFLASTLAPDYGKSGFMGGILHQLTMGGWCYELPGFISKLSLGIPQESPWEIAIPATDDGGDPSNPIFSDPTVKEMPHICNVSIDFTPIHRFRPELQDNTYNNSGNEVSSYGKQRFIQLTNGLNTNYVPVSLAQAQEGIGSDAENEFRQFLRFENKEGEQISNTRGY